MKSHRAHEYGAAFNLHHEYGAAFNLYSYILTEAAHRVRYAAGRSWCPRVQRPFAPLKATPRPLLDPPLRVGMQVEPKKTAFLQKGRLGTIALVRNTTRC